MWFCDQFFIDLLTSKNLFFQHGTGLAIVSRLQCQQNSHVLAQRQIGSKMAARQVSSYRRDLTCGHLVGRLHVWVFRPIEKGFVEGGIKLQIALKVTFVVRRLHLCANSLQIGNQTFPVLTKGHVEGDRLHDVPEVTELGDTFARQREYEEAALRKAGHQAFFEKQEQTFADRRFADPEASGQLRLPAGPRPVRIRLG